MADTGEDREVGSVEIARGLWRILSMTSGSCGTTKADGASLIHMVEKNIADMGEVGDVLGCMVGCEKISRWADDCASMRAMV